MPVWLPLLVLFSVIFSLVLVLRTVRLPCRRVPLKSARGGREAGLVERWYSASAESETMANFGMTIELRGPPDAAWWRQELIEIAWSLYSSRPLLAVSIVDDYGEGSKVTPVHNLVRHTTTADAGNAVRSNPACLLSLPHLCPLAGQHRESN